MKDENNFFLACAKILGDLSDCADGSRAVLDFLEAMEYLERTVDGLEMNKHVDTSNAQALMMIAARFERAFSLPMRHAPGAHFFGGTVPPADFGITGHSLQVLSVGGRGQTFAEAFESCVGEATELLSILEREDDPLLSGETGPRGLCERELSWVACSFGWEPRHMDRVLDWVNAKSLFDSRTVSFPLELVLRRPEPRRLGKRSAESNGVGAGRDFSAATLSALMEVIERDAAALWWYGGQMPRMFFAEKTNSSGFAEFLSAVRGDSTRRTWFLDITTDIAVPVIAALACDADGGRVVAGFSADISSERALRRATLELCQMELAQDLSIRKAGERNSGDLTDRDRNWIRQSKEFNVGNFPRLNQGLPFDGWPSNNGTGGQLAQVLERLSNLGLEAYVVDLYREEIGVHVARVLVPGTQSTDPDWISERLRRSCEANNVSNEAFTNVLTPF